MPPLHTPDDQAAYFGQFVRELRDVGAFDTFETPKQLPVHDLTPQHKCPHADAAKNAVGSMHHLGDEPYNYATNTIGGYADNPPLHQQQVALKTAAARQTINTYFPADTFIPFLQFFTEHPTAYSHESARKASRKQLVESACNVQRGIMRSTKQAIKDYCDADMLEEALDAPRPNDRRSALMKSEALTHVADYPELTATILLFHAAHRCYHSQLDAAIIKAKERGELSTDQFDNANFVMGADVMDATKNFLFLQTMLPLIITEYEKDHPYPPNGEIDHDAMKQAIGSAWRVFDDRKILTTEQPDKIARREEGQKDAMLTLTCPAKSHFKRMEKEHVLEDTYDYVREHPQELSQVMREVKNITAEMQHELR